MTEAHVEEASRHIPESIKREVRQRCRFGCIICGTPVYHYDHIEEFSIVNEHKAENIALLCPTHHQDKTSKRVPTDVVKKHNDNPFNSSANFTKSHTWYFCGDVCQFDIGGNVFTYNFRNLSNRFDAIVIGGESLIGFELEDGVLLLNMSIRDVDGVPLLEVLRGELILSTAVQDIKMVGTVLEIVPANNLPTIKISKKENGIDLHQGIFIGRTGAVQAFPDRVEIHPGRMTMAGCGMHNCQVGLAIN